MSQITKKNADNRIEELVNEIKILRTVNSNLHARINSLESRIHSKASEIGILEDRLGKSKLKIHFMESEKASTQKKYVTRIKNLENERRRNDVFNQKNTSTSGARKESFMIQEMDSLRAVNKTLLGIIDLLSNRIGFDGEVIKCISEIADGVKDNILQLFVNSIQSKLIKLSEDLELENISNESKSKKKVTSDSITEI